MRNSVDIVRDIAKLFGELADSYEAPKTGYTPLPVPEFEPAKIEEVPAFTEPVPAVEAKATASQNRLVQIIDEHEAELAESIKDMGCGGDCYRCPHPEFKTVDEQVDSCLKSVVEALGLEGEV